MKMIKIHRVTSNREGKCDYYGVVYLNSDKIVCIEDSIYDISLMDENDEKYKIFEGINKQEKFADVQIEMNGIIESFLSVESACKISMEINH